MPEIQNCCENCRVTPRSMQKCKTITKFPRIWHKLQNYSKFAGNGKHGRILSKIAELIQNCRNMARILKYCKTIEYRKEFEAIVKFTENSRNCKIWPNCKHIPGTLGHCKKRNGGIRQESKKYSKTQRCCENVDLFAGMSMGKCRIVGKIAQLLPNITECCRMQNYYNNCISTAKMQNTLQEMQKSGHYIYIAKKCKISLWQRNAAITTWQKFCKINRAITKCKKKN